MAGLFRDLAMSDSTERRPEGENSTTGKEMSTDQPVEAGEGEISVPQIDQDISSVDDKVRTSSEVGESVIVQPDIDAKVETGEAEEQTADFDNQEKPEVVETPRVAEEPAQKPMKSVTASEGKNNIVKVKNIAGDLERKIQATYGLPDSRLLDGAKRIREFLDTAKAARIIKE